MPESQLQWRTIAELADTNPEPLGLGADPHTRFKYVDLSSVSAGTVAWNSAPEVALITAPSRARRVLRRGDVLFGTVRPNLRSHGYVDWTGQSALLGSTGFSVIRAKAGVSDSRYLFHCIMSSCVSEQANRHAVGSSYPALNDSDVRRFEVYAPPLDEQVAIAQILDTLDATIRRTEAIIEKLKQVKQGLLDDLLNRGIDANGELRPPQRQAPHLYKESPLGWIPREWVPHALGQVLNGRTRNGLYKPSSFHGSGPLMVQMGGMFCGEAVDFQSATRVRVTQPELNAYRLDVGDLLFARRSLTFEGAGQCAIVRYLPEASTFESSIVRARVDRSRVEPEFAALFLRGALSSAQRRTLIRQVAVSEVSSDDIAHFLIALPQPAEQAAIIDAIASVQSRIEHETVETRKLSLQKAGLMDDLLTGRVRVTPLLA